MHKNAQLNDPEPAKEIRKLVDRAKADPAFAKEWLIAHGFLTQTGKTLKRFGGS